MVFNSRALGSLSELRLPPDLAAFRAEVRAFLAEEMASERVRGHEDAADLTGLDDAFERAHLRRAGERGFLGIAMPPEYGGSGKPGAWKAVYDYEAAYHDAPSIDTAVTLCGAPLVRYGTASQRAHWLPRMIAGELNGCIAYSEKGAGSDLAALSSTGEYRDGRWHLRGHKALITGAHKADTCVTLVKTETGAAPRDAMSLFVFALPHPGVTVRRRATMNAWTLSEIDFEDAVLDDAALLGQRGKGWSMVLSALGDERAGMAWLGWATRMVEDLFQRFDDPELARAAVELGVARRFAERMLTPAPDGQRPAHHASVTKVWTTELLQRIARLGVRLEGEQALRWSPIFQGGSRFTWELIERIHCAISVGANEVQRDMIARFGLGLGRS
jgi:alkylation response protein AidB-like acyl-CoA dehydrogenase